MESDLVAVQTEARTARTQSGEATAKLETALAQSTKQRDALSKEVATLRQDKQRTEESLAQMRAQPALGGQVEAQKTQIGKLESDLAAARTEARVANESVNEAIKLEAALSKSGQEKDALSAEIAALRRDKQRAEETRDQMRVDLSEARSKLEGYDASVRDGSLVEVASLREALRRSEMKVDMTTRAFAEIEQENARLQTRLREAESKALAAELAGRDESSEIERLREELAGAEQARTAALAERASAVRDLSAAQIRNENLVRELSRARPGTLLASDTTPRVAPTRSPAPQSVAIPAPVAPEPRVHTVANGENLSIISNRYYRTPNRWPEIYDANRDVMRSENHVVPGMKLRIP
jgi:nucleoid-associated protein YgaU